MMSFAKACLNSLNGAFALVVSAYPAVQLAIAGLPLSAADKPLQTPLNRRSQAILNHLLSGRSLTQGQAVALGYGPQPIAATIFKLRVMGHDIITRNKRDIHGVRYAEYRLGSSGAQKPQRG